MTSAASPCTPRPASSPWRARAKPWCRAPCAISSPAPGCASRTAAAMRCGGYPRRCISIPFWVGSKEAGQATCSFDWAVDDVFLPVSGEASRNRSNLRLALRSPQTCAFLNLSRRYRPGKRAAQLLGRLQCEFDGDASPRPERRVHEIDRDRLFQESVVRMVVRHHRVGQLEPPVATLAGAVRADDLDDRGAHAGIQKRGALFRQVLVQEREYLLPAVHRLLDAVGRPVVVEETVSGAVVPVKLVLLAVLLELGLVLVHLLRGRRTILVAEETEQRAGKVLRKLDRRGRLLRVQLLLAHHHPAAPKLAGGVDVLRVASKQEGLPPARAGAEYPDLAIEPGLSAQPRHGTLGVADDLSIGNATLGAHLGGDIVGFALARPVIEVMADRRIAVMRELAGRLAVPLVPAGRMMKQHHAGEGAGTQRPRNIGRDRLGLVAGDRNGLPNHSFIVHW